MTKEQIQNALKDGKTIEYSSWHFFMFDDGRIYMNCWNGTCENDFKDVDDLLDFIGEKNIGEVTIRGEL